MGENNFLNVKSLKEQVYDYFRMQMRKGELRPGDIVNLDATSRKLGISKTPLREALIMLEMEGFVSIMPRKGVYVNRLTYSQIREFYEVIGSLEARAIINRTKNFPSGEIQKMQTLNDAMRKAMEKDDFDEYYARNLDFHNTYINLASNHTLAKLIDTLKKRLYDFPRQERFIKEWEISSIEEHQKIVDLLNSGKISKAADYVQNIHWSYDVQEKFIKQYYSDLEE